MHLIALRIVGKNEHQRKKNHFKPLFKSSIDRAIRCGKFNVGKTDFTRQPD